MGQGYFEDDGSYNEYGKNPTKADIRREKESAKKWWNSLPEYEKSVRKILNKYDYGIGYSQCIAKFLHKCMNLPFLPKLDEQYKITSQNLEKFEAFVKAETKQ